MISSGDLVAEDSYLRIIPRSEKLHGRHLTQKPLRLVWQSLLASTCEGDLAYHSSCGSVTMAVAAKELDRCLSGRRWMVELFVLGTQGRSRARRMGSSMRTLTINSQLLTQKPLRLVWQSLLASTCEGDLAYHSSCGSVTMAVAAKELDRCLSGRRWMVELFVLGTQGRSRARRMGSSMRTLTINSQILS